MWFNATTLDRSDKENSQLSAFTEACTSAVSSLNFEKEGFQIHLSNGRIVEGWMTYDKSQRPPLQSYAIETPVPDLQQALKWRALEPVEGLTYHSAQTEKDPGTLSFEYSIPSDGRHFWIFIHADARADGQFSAIHECASSVLIELIAEKKRTGAL